MSQHDFAENVREYVQVGWWREADAKWLPLSYGAAAEHRGFEAVYALRPARFDGGRDGR